MPCTLSSLIGSYFDLFLTQLLLIGSTFFFFGSKLGIPFINQIQSFLYSEARARIESVQGSVLNGFGSDKVVGRTGSGMGRKVRKRRMKSREEKFFGDGMCMAAEASSPTRDIYASNFDVEMKVKNLEQKLEKSEAALAAVYLDLEKERNAAASAADEAMAMILRLQSEKASLELESRQCQRMIEEKSMYDEEEMNVLKEIIVKRELEKHVLEKEVEAYRQITREMKPDSLFDSADDPALMLASIYKSIENEEKEDNDADKGSIEFQEKGMVTLDVYPSDHCESSNSGEKAIKCKLDRDDEDEDQKRSDFSQSETESSVLDVHVIDDEDILIFKENEKAKTNDDHSTKTPPMNLDFDLRSSMSTNNSKRSKLASEVEILRKRLKTIQEGKRNLNAETFDLQLLEEIACQLDEIRERTEPEKKMRQSSLPPLSPEAFFPKKRRCHSVSSFTHESA